MNSTHGITVENLLLALPEVLRNDESMAALAASIAGVLSQRPREIRELLIYARIDELPEELLDILANDFKVDWWSYDYAIEEKRRTLKDSWYVHGHLGTKGAVERAISAIYPDTRVVEWFEYGGKPYYFRLVIPVDQTALDPAKHVVVLSLVESYKNLRSVLEEVEYTGTGSATEVYAGATFIGYDITDGAVALNYAENGSSGTVTAYATAAFTGSTLTDFSDAE